VKGPVNLSRLFNVYEQTPAPGSPVPQFCPRELRLDGEVKDLFGNLGVTTSVASSTILRRVIFFIESAAATTSAVGEADINRTNEHSLIVPLLIDRLLEGSYRSSGVEGAFRRGSNIRWARSWKCGRPGFHGLVGLKPIAAFIAGAPRPRWVTRSYAQLVRETQRDHSPHLHESSLFTADPEITRCGFTTFSAFSRLCENPAMTSVVAPSSGGKVHLLIDAKPSTLAKGAGQDRCKNDHCR